MQDLDQYFNNKINKGVSSEIEGKKTYFSYLWVNSLFRERSSYQQNIMHYELVPKANSSDGVIGIYTNPTKILHLKLNQITLPVQSQPLLGNVIFVFIQEFSTNSIPSPYGFNYHFCGKVNAQYTTNLFQYATIDFPSYYFDTPIGHKGALTFALFNEAGEYTLPEDQFECYIDYSGTNYTFEIIGSTFPSLNSSYHLIAINCILPIDGQDVNILKNVVLNVTSQTGAIINTGNLIQIGLATNINRPADKTLGVYNGFAKTILQPGIITTLTTDIVNGLVDGDEIKIAQVNDQNYSWVIGKYRVQNVNTALKQFDILLDTTSIPYQLTVYITDLPINLRRRNKILIRVVEFTVQFQFAMVSVSSNAFGAVQTVSF